MRKLLTILLLFISFSVSATNYYVKNGGNDGLSGTSDANAWATITKVNSIGFVANDTIFFKCGSTWREQKSLTLRSGTSSGRIVYTSYSTGAKPLILGSIQKNSTGDWVSLGSNLWRCTDAVNFAVDMGNLIFDNEASVGTWKHTIEEVTAQGHFYFDRVGTYVTLYSVSNPATFYSNIECALYRSTIVMQGNDYFTIDGLDLRYSAQHGINSSGGNNYVTIKNCDITMIGGGGAGTTHRLGNGVEFWLGCTNILIENNFIENCYDAGITSQGTTTGTYNVTNFIARNNIVNKCEYSFEMINNQGATAGATNGFYFENNTCVNAGGGVFHNQRYTGVSGRHIRFSTMEGTYANFFIRNNIFSNATESGIYGFTIPAAIVIDYNIYNVSVMASVNGTTYTSLAQWQTFSNDDAHSLSDNPDFTSSTDFHLTEGSPAIDAALGVGIDYDYDGNLRDGAPDIGAFEFDPIIPEPPPPLLATITTTQPVYVEPVSGTSGGNVISDGNGTVTDRGVCWATTINPTIENDTTKDGSGEGIFTSSITGLEAYTTYHVRAYAINEVGTSYGDDMTFTTTSSAEYPSLFISTQIQATAIKAIVNAEVTRDGYSSVTARGICWSLSANPTIFDEKTTEGTGVGGFTSTLTNLLSGTTYHIRAYATNSYGTAYSSDLSFTTLNYSIYSIGGKLISSRGKLQTISNTPSSLLTGLIGYWNFNEETLYDAVGNNDATVFGATVNQTGLIGNGVSFDGTNDYVSIPIQPTGNAMALSIWFKLTLVPLTPVDAVFAFKHSASPYTVAQMYVGTSGKTFAGVTQDNASVISINPTTVLTHSVWYHYVLNVKTTGEVSGVWLNGTRIGTGTLTLPRFVGNSILILGDLNATPYWPFNGVIDEVALFSRSLTDSEIAELYNTGSGNAHPFN